MPTITPFTYSGGHPGTLFVNSIGAASLFDTFALHPSPAYVLIKHLHFANITAAPTLVTVYANAASGTAVLHETLWKNRELKAYATYDWYSPGLKLLSTGSGSGFITAFASAPDAITFFVIGDIVTP